MLQAIKIPCVSRKFARSQRLQRAEEFRSVLQNRKIFTGTYLRLYIKLNHTNFARLGLIIAKRIERKAVKRNRVKRVIREIFRLRQQTITGLDCVMQLRTPVDTPADYFSLRMEASMLLAKAEKYLGRYETTVD